MNRTIHFKLTMVDDGICWYMITQLDNVPISVEDKVYIGALWALLDHPDYFDWMTERGYQWSITE